MNAHRAKWLIIYIALCEVVERPDHLVMTDEACCFGRAEMDIIKVKLHPGANDLDFVLEMRRKNLPSHVLL